MSFKYILASVSPRRKELLSRFISTFDVLPANVDESIDASGNIDDEILKIAKLKAYSIPRRRDNVVIAADTVVTKDKKVLSKPLNKDEAYKMLKFLNNDSHTVITAVSVVSEKIKFEFIDKTVVTFNDNSEELISAYINSAEPYDKAGAYGIQGRGALLVNKIEGDYNNVVGLPLSRLINKLLSSGLLEMGVIGNE